MNETYNSMTSKFIELTADTYRTYIKSLIWGQERALEFTKEMLQRAETFQQEGKTLVDEYAENVRRGQKMVQEVLNNTMKSSQEVVNQYRQATRENIDTVNQQFDSMQNHLKETVSVN